MFGAKQSGKKRKNRQSSRHLPASQRGPVVDDEQPKAGASAAGPESASDGLSIENYAAKTDLSEAEVWRMLRRGEVIGRTQQGHLLVFGAGTNAPDPEPVTLPEAPEAKLPPGPTPNATIDDLTFLPPLPSEDGRVTLARSGASAGEFLTLSGERASSPELALLLDHLSLAKEENREILRMAQDSIKKVSEMSDAMLEMKDRVIDARESELLALKEQLARRDGEMKKLRQQNEDLEMLANTMATSQRRP